MDVSKISRRIRISYQKIKGQDDGVEDCVQSVLLAMLEGRHQHATIDQAVIDYLRVSSGRKGDSSYDARKALASPHPIEPGGFDPPGGFDQGRHVEARRDSWRLLNYIGDAVDRGCFALTHKWGLSEAEIGDIFGFSASRASQRVKRVQGRLSTRAALEKSRDAEKRASKVAGVLQEKTKPIWGRMEQVSFERMAGVESFRMASLDDESF